jgi:hypothetical protein
METIKKLYLRSWRGIVLALSLAATAYLLYFHRLGSLVPGYSTPELETLRLTDRWQSILSDPINAPYKLFAWLFTAEFHHSILALRVVSSCFGILILSLFYIAVRTWCTYRSAYLATAMFATSAGLLHFARLGTGDILQMSLLGLLDVVIWYRYRSKHRMWVGYLIVALFALLWYIPGMLWFEVLGMLALQKIIINQLRRAKTIHLVGLSAILIVVWAPLAVAIIRNPRLFLEVVGLPQKLGTLTHVGTYAWQNLSSIVIHSYGPSVLWVGHAPLLDAVEVIIGLLGIYYIVRNAPARRTFLLGSAVIGLLLASLGGSVSIAPLVPILYLCIANGIDNLLGQWLSVFPRNPVVRIAGIAVVCIMIFFSVLYQVRTYYVAWPHAPATRQTFNHLRA